MNVRSLLLFLLNLEYYSIKILIIQVARPARKIENNKFFFVMQHSRFQFVRNSCLNV